MFAGNIQKKMQYLLQNIEKLWNKLEDWYEIE